MELNVLTAISPVDGRYFNKTEELSKYFSEYALFRYRIQVEIEYFIALCKIPLPQLKGIKSSFFEKLRKIYKEFPLSSALRIKEIEKKTNHDIKAVEYFLREEFKKNKISKYAEFIHFGLTSQDINNTALPLFLKEAIVDIYYPKLNEVTVTIAKLSSEWKKLPMLARTHGQPASPTTLGKEMNVFVKRIEVQLGLLNQIPFSAKFGGATGNFNAHFVAFPKIDWHKFAEKFVNKELGLSRSFPTTQIEHYDNLAALFDNLRRINNILLDFCRDIWAYISIEYFKQKIVKEEVGSSAMPHKVNPIDFENAEGNLGFANSIFEFMSNKLPISRLQRDLTDSTVLRNIGLPFSHTLIAMDSLLKGLKKLYVNEGQIKYDLDKNWSVIAEALQTILRREGYPNPYEALKNLTRLNNNIYQADLKKFIENLDINENTKKELLKITPHNYIGK